MIKTIIAVGDIHIRNLRRSDEYNEILNKFLKECKEIVNKHNSPDEVRIVIAGDLLHSKLEISSEGYAFASWFLQQCDSICKTILISGNHDMNMSNLNRLEPLSAIFSMCNFNQTYFLDRELGYSSGCMLDDNIIWCLYSPFSEFNKPNIDNYKKEYPDKTYVGLYHGAVKNAKTDVGYTFENGFDSSYFDGLNFGILGHIHKRQCIKYNGIQLLYCGSIIQQEHGESISNHGYVVWNVEEETYEEKNIANDNFGFYTFAINSIDDIDNDKETLINL